MSSEKALQSCRACRRLKRKCFRELPSCSLCIRLNKSCEYPDTSSSESATPTSVNNSLSERLRHLEQLLDQADQLARVGGVFKNVGSAQLSCIFRSPPIFPNAYFLDSEFFSPLNPDALSIARAPPLVTNELRDLALDAPAICHAFFSSVYIWLPIVSKKRLMHEISTAELATDRGLPLLLLSMKLLSEPPNPDVVPQLNPFYQQIKALHAAAEGSGWISVRLLQSGVLIAVYELSHGIHPAGYLTVGHTARLGVMMGFHDRRYASQLFKPPDTWTLREEERRTWWAVFILDRYVNIETAGMPLSTPEPGYGDLLPTNDITWDEGAVGGNEPLLTTTFYSASNLGTFARTCQVAHILGRVLEHRTCRRKIQTEAKQQLTEALQLHQVLVALDASLHLPDTPPSSPNALTSGANDIAEEQASQGDFNMLAVAICTSARFLLYSLYGCNEPETTYGNERLAMETEMQRIAVAGIRDMAQNRVPGLVRTAMNCAIWPAGEVGAAGIPPSPLISASIYAAATECAWFIREDHDTGMYEALQILVEGLRYLNTRWRVAGEYLKILEQGEVLDLLES